MDYAFCGGFVYNRDCCGKSLFGSSYVFLLDGFTNPFYKSFKGCADMLVPGIFYLVLFDTLKSRLVMSQTAPPINYMNSFEIKFE